MGKSKLKPVHPGKILLEECLKLVSLQLYLWPMLYGLWVSGLRLSS